MRLALQDACRYVRRLPRGNRQCVAGDFARRGLHT